MKKTTASQGYKLAILGTALAVSGAAFAADGAGPQRFHDRAGHHAAMHHGHHAGAGHSGHHFHHHGKSHRGHALSHRAGMVVPGYGIVSRDFVDGMGLNEDQLKLIEAARSAAKEFRESRKDRVKAEREARGELLKSASIDPEQALKQADERRAQAQAERRQIDEKWIAAWKSLDGDQQARVADHLKQRA